MAVWRYRLGDAAAALESGALNPPVICEQNGDLIALDVVQQHVWQPGHPTAISLAALRPGPPTAAKAMTVDATTPTTQRGLSSLNG